MEMVEPPVPQVRAKGIFGLISLFHTLYSTNCNVFSLLLSHSVTIDVNSVSDPPVANDDYASTNEDTPIGINVLDGRFGGLDSDPDGDTLTTMLLSGPINGGVVLNANGNVVYSPDTNFYGQDSFVYTISDGTGEMATATGADKFLMVHVDGTFLCCITDNNNIFPPFYLIQ